MPKGKYTRKAHMQPDETGAASAAPTPDPAPDQSALILGLLEKMSGQISAFGDRLTKVENSAPRFIPSTPETYSADHDRYQIAELAPADAMPRSQTVPITSDGIRIPAAFISEYPARFGSGSRVRLNLDAVPHGNQPKTRGQLMEEKGVPNAPGEVIDRTFLTKKVRDGKRGVWKYRCQFPREVGQGAVMGVISLHEDELIPA